MVFVNFWPSFFVGELWWLAIIYRSCCQMCSELDYTGLSWFEILIATWAEFEYRGGLWWGMVLRMVGGSTVARLGVGRGGVEWVAGTYVKRALIRSAWIVAAEAWEQLV